MLRARSLLTILLLRCLRTSAGAPTLSRVGSSMSKYAGTGCLRASRSTRTVKLRRARNASRITSVWTCRARATRRLAAITAANTGSSATTTARNCQVRSFSAASLSSAGTSRTMRRRVHQRRGWIASARDRAATARRTRCASRAASAASRSGVKPIDPARAPGQIRCRPTRPPPRRQPSTTCRAC